MTDVPAFNAAHIDSLSPSDLKITESMKWTMFPKGYIGAFVAEMDFGTAPSVQQALRTAIDNQTYGYMPTRFTEELYEACAAFQREVNNWDVSAENVFGIVDVIAALEMTITNFSSRGSPVIVPTPAYPPFFSVPQNLEREIINVPMLRDDKNRWVLDLDGIAAAFEAGAEMLILCNPHNPTGRVHTAAELTALADVVTEHSGRVFSDEIHSPLVFAPHRHVPYAAVSEKAASHTITATATSKAWNIPGLKCAQVIISNDADLERWKEVGGFAAYGASGLGAVASTAAYSGGREWLNGALEYLEKNRNLIATRLAAELPEVKFDPPEGTYLAWLDFRETAIADSPGDALRDGARVAMSDGAGFGEPGQGWVRLNFATPTPILDDALDRIIAFTKSQQQQ